MLDSALNKRPQYRPQFLPQLNALNPSETTELTSYLNDEIFVIFEGLMNVARSSKLGKFGGGTKLVSPIQTNFNNLASTFSVVALHLLVFLFTSPL